MRSLFVRFAIGLAVLMGTILDGHGAELHSISLPAATQDGGKPLMAALKDRRTTREFAVGEIPAQKLGDLLWAAFGVNRPENQHRTAPSAMNSQEIDIYVARAEGLFLYDAKAHQLSPVSKTDVRPISTGQSYASNVIVLVYVADLPRLSKAKAETRPFYAAFDAGCICQNVYLYCASAGLATVVYDLNRPPLAKAMNLRETQQIIMAQAVGLPR